ncbi:MAG: hypothetical protein AAFY42_05330 [Pseudomonadota bacterium]
MIVVLEGISAAGKTTFARQFGTQHHVPEFPEHEPFPHADDPLEAHAVYWVEHNTRRFQAALKVEAEHGFAICDTEPLKSHFDWCMARAGFKTMDIFRAAMPIVRKAIEERRLGFGTRYYVKRIDPEVARLQKEGDATRSRRNFEMHLALQPHLIDWFEALSHAMPSRVEFAFPDKDALLAELKSKAPEEDPRRFDVSALDALINRLPR